MNILDENFPDDERKLLHPMRIPVRKVGRDIGRKGMNDDEIIPLLHPLDRLTFFTQDVDFLKRRLCHSAYCLVFLDIEVDALAAFVRRVLRHPELRSKAKRMGCVIHVQPKSISLWRIHEQTEIQIEW